MHGQMSSESPTLQVIVQLRCSACAGSIPLPSTASLVQFVLVLSGGIRQGVSQDGARRFSCHGRLWLCGTISELFPYDRHDLVLYSWLTGGRLSTGAGACALVPEAARPHEEGTMHKASISLGLLSTFCCRVHGCLEASVVERVCNRALIEAKQSLNRALIEPCV